MEILCCNNRTDLFVNLFKVATYDIFCFNNGLLKIADKLINVCRVIYTNRHVHPWKIWGSTYSGGHNRTNLGSEIDHNYDHNNISISKIEGTLYDSTGLVIQDSNNNIIFATNKLFGEEWNQDTRITQIESTMYLTYTSRINNFPTMLSRELKIDFEKKYINLSKETYMNEAYKNKVEKNWVYVDKYIDYSIDGSHIFFDKETKQKCEILISHILDLKKAYGKNNLLFSQGTPPIKFTNNEYLAVGHLKIDYRKKYDCLPFEDFRKINLVKKNLIKLHGKFIYMMFFYTYDKDSFVIKKWSHGFIPSYSLSHLPYFLVFPISLILLDDKYLVTYGEGDVRCNSVTFFKKDVDDLLQDIETIHPTTYKFIIKSI